MNERMAKLEERVANLEQENYKLKADKLNLEKEAHNAYQILVYSFYEPNKKTVYFEGNLGGTLDSISFNNLDFEYEQDLHLKGNLQLKNLQKTLSDIYVTANIERLKFSVSGLQDIIASAQRKPLTLPKELFNLGTCFYIGNIQGHFRNLQLNGLLHTNIGNIKTDVKLAVFNKFNDAKINGSITSRNLHLKKLFPNSQFGDISFNISINYS